MEETTTTSNSEAQAMEIEEEPQQQQAGSGSVAVMAEIVFGKLCDLSVRPEQWSAPSALSAALETAKEPSAAFLELACALASEVNALGPALGLTFSAERQSLAESLEALLLDYGEEYLWDLQHLMDTPEARVYLLDFLSSELQLLRMQCAEIGSGEQRPKDAVAAALADLLVELDWRDAPLEDISALTATVGERIVQMTRSDRRLMSGEEVSQQDMETLQRMSEVLKKEYEKRKLVLLRRLDVTLRSLLWCDRIQDRVEEVRALIVQKRADMASNTSLGAADVFCADESLTVVHKITDGSSAAQRIPSAARNFLLSADIPDRGGRVAGSKGAPAMPKLKDRSQATDSGSAGNYGYKRGRRGNNKKSNNSNNDGGQKGGGSGRKKGGKKKKSGGNRKRGGRPRGGF